jgi:hypothetical protein
VEAEGCIDDLGETLPSLSLSLDGKIRGYFGKGTEKLFLPSDGSKYYKKWVKIQILVRLVS